jgi:hypothetical protein
MRQRTVLPFLLALLLLAVAMPLHVLADTRVEITSPSVGERVRGRVPIIGSAQVDDFDFYKVEFGIGPNPSQWAVIGILHDQPVIAGQLEVWDTNPVPDGVYTLRVTGVKRDGNWVDFDVRNVVVANQEPTPTPTVEATETPEVELLPSPVGGETPAGDATPEGPTPEPTQEVQIIAPTAALAVPSVTPRVGPTTTGDQLPIETDTLGQSFCFGGLAMGAVFLLLGLVFGIRRLF